MGTQQSLGDGKIISKAGSYSLKANLSGSMVQGLINDSSLTAKVSTPDQWHHYAMTYDSSKLSLYLDGRLVNSTALSGPIATNSNPLRIGEEFSGTLEEVRIYNQSMSESQVESLMLISQWKNGLSYSPQVCDATKDRTAPTQPSLNATKEVLNILDPANPDVV